MVRDLSALGLLALVVAGCGTGKDWIYEKPNVTPIHLDQDMTQCRRDATVRGGFAIFASQRVDRTLFNSCMAKKGYTAREEHR